MWIGVITSHFVFTTLDTGQNVTFLRFSFWVFSCFVFLSRHSGEYYCTSLFGGMTLDFFFFLVYFFVVLAALKTALSLIVVKKIQKRAVRAGEKEEGNGKGASGDECCQSLSSSQPSCLCYLLLSHITHKTINQTRQHYLKPWADF